MDMQNKKGQFVKGFCSSPNTQFKKGQHWRSKKPYWDKDWLIHQYLNLGKSAGDISKEFGCIDKNILYFLKKFNIKTRSISEARKNKYWGQIGVDNPMWNKKGELNPQWKGGITPERQSFYISQEWRNACSKVWKRDNATCQRCKIQRKETEIPFHIHHIKSFKDKELRAVTKNLILLCEVCHQWVHSRGNKNNDYIQ